MKTLTLSAVALTLFAGIASASTAHDFDRFGVNPDELSTAQELAISNAVHGGASDSEVRALVQSIAKNG